MRNLARRVPETNDLELVGSFVSSFRAVVAYKSLRDPARCLCANPKGISHDPHEGRGV